MSGRHARTRWSGSAVAAAVLAGVLVVPALPAAPAAATPPPPPLAGAVDTGFGDEGQVLTSLDGNDTEPVVGPVLLPDGDLVVALETERLEGEFMLPHWELLRVREDGSPETGWSTDGRLPLDFEPRALLVEPQSGDLYAAGGTTWHRVITRLVEDGSGSPGFGSGGALVSEGSNVPTALALQGERLLVGHDDGSITALDAASGGTVEAWGTYGTVDVAGADGMVALEVDEQDRLYVGAAADGPDVVVRLLPDGTEDAGATAGTGYGDPGEGGGRAGRVELGVGLDLRDLEVRPGGDVVAVGSGFSDSGVSGHALTLDSDGQRVAEESVLYAGGDYTVFEDVALDPDGRALLAGTWAPGEGEEHPLLARLTTDGRLDPGFGQTSESTQQGVQLSSCATEGSGRGVAQADDQRIVLASSCDDSATERTSSLLSAYHAEPGGISDLVLTADAPEVAAAPSTVHTAEVPAEALETALEQVATSPLRYSPLRYSPLRYSPLRYSPLRYSPLRYSPLDTAALAEVTLAQVPLAYVPGAVQDWDEVLLDTKYEGHPLASVYVHEVLGLQGVPGTPDLAAGEVTQAKADEIASLQLERIDLSRTAYRDATLAGLLLPDTSLSALPEPQGGWCDYVKAQLDPCPSLSEATLLLLTVAGVDLEPWLALAQPLAGRDLRETPLGSVPLDEVDLERTALGQLPVATLQGSSRFCSTRCGGTLAEADVPKGITLGVLLHDGLPAVQKPVASVVDLVAGLLQPEDVPWESLELDGVLDALPVDPADPSTTYRAQFTASCAALDETLIAQVQLPAGARYVPDSARLSVPGGEGSRDVPISVTVTPGSPPPSEVAGPDTDVVTDIVGPVVSATPTAQVDCGEAESLRATYTLRAIAPRELAPTRAGAVVQSGPVRLAVGEQAPVEVRDPHDLPLAEDGEPQVAPLRGDTLTLGYLGRRGAADYYSLPVSPGSTVTLTLSHLRVDFDLLVYDDLPVDPDGVPAAVENTPLRYSPLRYSPLRYSPTDDAEAGTDATAALPEDLQGVPLLEKRLRRASAARGKQVEAVRVRVREGEPDRLIVGVVPFNGAVASTPYVLHTAVEGPQVPLECSERTFVAPAPAVTTPLPTITSGTQSLVLVHRARMTALHGSGVEGSGGLWEALQAFAAHPLVKGAVVDVGSDPEVRAAYAALDDDPCSVPAANEVVSRINQLVDEIRGPATQLRFVTLIGDDEALPMGRVPDLTDIANQVDHAAATRVGERDNAVSRAFAQGYLLSDDPYGSLAPSAFLDTQLFVPDLAVGRLVETPAEIRTSLLDFTAKGGKRPLAGAFISSYDFLTDLGAQLSDLSEAQGRSTTSRNDDTWTKADARTGVAQNPSGLLSVNAHFDQYRALPADQDAKGTQDQLLEASTDLPPSLSGSLLVTVGCNAGLNLSDLLLRTVADESEQEIARTRDWAQLTSSRGGVLIANTGFGYGDDTAVAYSERLVRHVVAGLDGSRTLGQALLFAKQQYLEASVFGVYDHKAVQQATFYGLPQWRIGDSGGLAPAVLPEAPTSNGVTTATTTTEAPSVQPMTSDRGTWYQVGSELPQVTAHRPVQPRTTRPLTAPASGLVAHGALLNGLVTRDLELADPAVSVPITDLAAAQPEPPVRNAFFPATLANVVSRSAPTGGRDQLVLVPGQYRGSEVAGQPGTQRLVDEAQVEVTWSGSSDFLPPTVPFVQGVLDPAGQRVGFTVEAPDEDTERVVVLYLPAAADGTPVAWKRLELQRAPSGLWTGAADVPTWSEEVGQFLVQAVDRAGNVTTNSNKAINYQAAALLEASSFDLAVAEGTGSATVTVVEQQATTTSAGTPSKAYRYTVNGGPSQPYPATGVVLGPGSHVVEVTDELGEVDQALVVVLGEVRIEVRTPVEGATYPATGLASSFSCTTPLGPAADCAGPARLETAVGEHVFTVTSGGASRTVRYRVVQPAALALDPPAALTVTDPAAVGARLLRWDGAPLPGRTVAFALGGARASGTTGPDGRGRASLVPQGPAGTQELSATAEGATVRRAVTVAPEQVTVTYTGDLLRAAPSLTSTSGPVTLSARVVQPDDGGLGDLASRAEVVFAVTGDDGVTRRVRATARTAADGGRALVASTTTTLPVGVHLVVPSVTGGWFAGTGAESPVTLHWPDGAPSLTGAGLVDARRATKVPSPVSTSRTDGWFGVHTALRTVKQKDRTVQEVKGVAAYGYTAADGTRWWFTGRTASQVSFPRNGHTATLTGPVSVFTVAGDGSVRKLAGTHTWQVDGADGKASRNVNDKDGVAFRVLDGSRREVLVVGSATAPLPLRKGEVVIRK